MNHYLLIVNDQQPHYAIDVSTSCTFPLNMSSFRCYPQHTGKQAISSWHHLVTQ
ncbi:hypothetical protein [Xenorhabdus nematophila]|uniref:hypothetical protein n=1 Tax=Xenorhabdus nematophila TaxID=628 RepID=UPI000ACCCCEE|nr:hypothetical protein [Xenorhabdus nematophila]